MPISKRSLITEKVYESGRYASLLIYKMHHKMGGKVLVKYVPIGLT